MNRIFFALFIVFAAAEANSAAPQILVRSEIAFEGSKVKFGDIAEIKNLPDAIAEKIRNIPICDAPGVGEVRKLTNFGISELVRYGFQNYDLGSQILSDVEFKIPKQVIIYSKFFNLKQSELEAPIGSWVLETCENCEIKINTMSIPKVEGFSGLAKWELQKSGVAPKGYFTVQIQVSEINKETRKFWVQGDLRILKTVPVAQRSMTSGQKLASEDVKFEKRDVTFSHEVAPTQTELLSSEVTRPIAASDILWKSYIKRKLALQKGQPVNLVMRSASWNVNAKGISEGFGYVGDMVKVLNPLTNKIIVGVLVDEQTVEVKE